jgi:cellulose synthase/poly-beta-1,6-N-acetylglucosamine synthase-like glycosyltransferase
MSVVPQELVIVDGGSTDGTSEIITGYIEANKSTMQVKYILDPRCNKKYFSSPVARGRNIAIQNASNEVIACTDAGCLVDKDWLANIVDPLLRDNTVDVVGGWYSPTGESFIQKCLALFWIIPAESLTDENIVPSSRSIAFRKSAWQKVGGYPEKYITAEDTMFALNLRAAGCRFAVRPHAVVYWPMPEHFGKFVKLVYRYAYGDGYCSLLPANVWKNIGKTAITILCGVAIYTWGIFGLAILLVWSFLAVHGKRIGSRIRIRHLSALPVLFILKTISDLTYIVGYIVGTGNARRTRR